MSKIMLVEDDNNLREIYEARLLAEGYEIVSAKDGEEALALAVKEKPDLIISDVMMPKISGFDMLDILRSTPETKETKVIMMTALSQAEDKTRADKLGADRYLVKSQVTLEDVANVAKEVLSGESESAPTAEASSPPPASPPAQPTTATPAPDTTSQPPAASPATTNDVPIQQQPEPAAPKEPQAPPPAPPAEPDPKKVEPAATAPANTPAQPATSDSAPAPQPVVSAQKPVEIADTTAHEQKVVKQQIDDFVEKQGVEEPDTTAPQQPEPPQSPPAPSANTPDSSSQEQVASIDVKTDPEASNDATNQATETAEKLANAVNDMLDADTAENNAPTAPQPAPQKDEPATTSNPVSASNKKKVISPINDISKKPDLEKLAAEEEAAGQSPASPPNTKTPNQPPVVTPTPPSSGGGTVIQPNNSSDPNSIAL